MAHAATLDRLADGLITSITGRTTKDAAFRSLKHKAARGLRDQSHGRTNQFAVSSRYEGLVEKLTVLNRDDLADALHTRLRELTTTTSTSKWTPTPELLALLLELSDRPAQTATLAGESVDNGASATDGPTWEQIMAEDPLNEPDVWDHVERGYHSSADELDDDGAGRVADDDGAGRDADDTSSTTATSVANDDPTATARLYLSQPDEASLSTIVESRQLARDRKRSRLNLDCSELIMIRNMFSAYRGVSSDVFSVQLATGKATVSVAARLAETSAASTSDLLQTVAKTASAISFLRTWARIFQPVPHMRAIQSSIQQLLVTFDKDLRSIEQRFVRPMAQAAVSALEVHDSIERAVVALRHLSSIVHISSLSPSDDQSVGMLDVLYDEACLSQLAGNRSVFVTIATIFLAGLHTYIRHVATWIRDGTLSSAAIAPMFVRVLDPDCESGRFWHNRYELRSGPNSALPKCISQFSSDIFALGKSRAFLRELNPQSAKLDNRSSEATANLPSYQDLRPQLDQESLQSFSHVLEIKLRAWIHDVSPDCMPLLKTALWSANGLSRSLHVLPVIFFSKNSSLFDVLARNIIEHIAGSERMLTWNDAFLLTEGAQSALGEVSGLEVSAVQVRVSSDEVQSVARSPTALLPSIQLQYRFPWPLQNVTRCVTSEVHAQAFAFLLQVHRARAVLQSSFFELRITLQIRPLSISLRQKLIWLTGVLHAYITTTASMLHTDMTFAMEAAVDIDSMVEIWAQYDRKLQRNLLLSVSLSPIRDAITAMLELSDLLVRTTQAKCILSLQNQFEKSLLFLVNGVRGISRAGGDPSLEGLADTLGWGLGLS